MFSHYGKSLFVLALNYFDRGWQIIPIPVGSKNPGFPDWPKARLKSRDSTAARQGLQRLSNSIPFIRQQSKSN
jgi:hypothetical protein